MGRFTGAQGLWLKRMGFTECDKKILFYTKMDEVGFIVIFSLFFYIFFFFLEKIFALFDNIAGDFSVCMSNQSFFQYDLYGDGQKRSNCP